MPAGSPTTGLSRWGVWVPHLQRSLIAFKVGFTDTRNKGHAGWKFAAWPLFLNEPESLLEGSDGAGFVVVDIEDGVQLGHL